MNVGYLTHLLLNLTPIHFFTKVRKKRRGAKRDSGGLCILLSNKLVNQFDIENWNFEDGLILKSKYPCVSNGNYLFLIFVY